MTHSVLRLGRQTSSSSLFRSRAEPYPVAMGATSSSEWETTSTTSADVSGTTPSASETEEEDEEDEEDVFTSPGEEEYDGDTNDEIVRSRRVSVVRGGGGRRYVGRRESTISNGSVGSESVFGSGEYEYVGSRWRRKSRSSPRGRGRGRGRGRSRLGPGGTSSANGSLVSISRSVSRGQNVSRSVEERGTTVLSSSEQEGDRDESAGALAASNPRLPHVPLKPFRNQVGGHSAIYKFTKRAVCKVGHDHYCYHSFH